MTVAKRCGWARPSTRITVHSCSIFGSAGQPHWARPQLNQVLWKFLADHTAHKIDVLLEGDMTEDMSSYQEIGGDSREDISFEEYLAGWPGLKQ